jgi:pimeloyl-ACP methyl ester carboxylesterase
VKQSQATLVLVHGAWHGSWCWQRVVPELAQLGVPVRTVDLPSVAPGAEVRAAGSTALSADAAAVRAVIDELATPVVLCGHSYGGMVISLAGAGCARVTGLVYLCAFMPDAGQSLVTSGGGKPASWVRSLEDGTTLPEIERAAELFYADCDRATQDWAVGLLRPHHAGAFAEPVPEPAWRNVPATYIVCAQDRAIPPEVQREQFAPKARQTFQLQASHSPFLSQPAALAALLAATTLS